MSFRLTAVAAAVVLAAVVVYQIKTAKPKQESVTVVDPAIVIVIRTKGGLLEVATLRKHEEFGWTSRYQCPLIDCPGLLTKTISKVRVPVHYVYRVPLAESWELILRGDHYELTVPGLEPHSPVSFDTTKMEVESTRGWLTPLARGNEQALLREFGPELQRRAVAEPNLRLVEPHAARTVEEFARRWMTEQKLTSDKPIRVRFRTSP